MKPLRRPALGRHIARWAGWLIVVVIATFGMYHVRESLDKAHVALAYLLLVLLASAAGGRALGLTVAALGFVFFDLFFLPPYSLLTIANPLDWLVLVAFLATSVVAAQLLYRATATAEIATQRAVEVDRLAALGAETLNAADVYEALEAIAGVIRTSLDADECDIYLQGPAAQAFLVARVSRSKALEDTQSASEVKQPGRLVDWIVEHGTSAVELIDGTVRVAYAPPAAERSDTKDGPLRAALQMVTHRELATVGDRLRGMLDKPQEPRGAEIDQPAVRALAVPLQVRDRTVGVLRISTENGLRLTPEQARLLTALAYYAALGAERARLVASAERVEAERRVERLRSALLTAVSHDLRTPLTTIKGIANELRHGADPERAGVIEQEVDWLDALVGDFLDLSRIHAGAVRPVLAVNTVDDLLGAALRRADGALNGRPVNVDYSRDELLAGTFDLAQSLRIVVNLLDNAAKYSPAGSPIDVRARRHGDRLVIEVMDRGPGVPEAERTRIFESFYRPPGSPPDIRGHGLGLSIARGLAEAQGGSVRYAPRDGGGSVFTLELRAEEVTSS